MTDKKWHLISPDGKFLYQSKEDFESNNPSYYLDSTSGNFVSKDVVPKRNWAAVKLNEPQLVFIP